MKKFILIILFIAACLFLTACGERVSYHGEQTSYRKTARYDSHLLMSGTTEGNEKPWRM